MKICIDATPLGTNTTDKGGVYRYIWELIESLSCLDKTNEYTLFFNFFRKEHFPVLNETVRRLSIGNNFNVKTSRYPARLQRFVELPSEFLSGRFDVMHGCFDYLRPILLGRGVVTVHDVRYLENLDYEYDPEWVKTLRTTAPSPDFYVNDCLCRNNLFSHLRSKIRKTINRADSVITVSEFSRSRIIEKLNVPPEKVKVIYSGVDKSFFPKDGATVKRVFGKLGINKPCLLYVGKFEPQKNIIRLLEAFKIVLNTEDVCLIMAGPVNWYYYIVMEKVRQLNIENSIIFTDYIKDEDLAALYSGASVFVFPSLYEGFGFPLLEAMACKLPIVTSGVCSIPEVVGDAALFADPDSPTDIAEKIICGLNDVSLREDLIERGDERVRNFSWDKTAFETLEVYNSLCN